MSEQEAVGTISGERARVSAAPPRARTLPAIALSERAKVALVLMVALLQGLLYLFLLPPWQHYDEPTHFEYAWLYAEVGRQPTEDDISLAFRREIAASMIEHDFYWNLAPPDLLQTEGKQISIGIIELLHPPAYYALVSLPLRLVHHLDLVTQLYVARGVSLFLFALIILVAAGIMCELLPPGHPLRWAVPLALALLPPFVNQMTAVNNDVGAVFVFSFFLWGAVRVLRRGLSPLTLLWLGGTALLSLLTKSTAGIAFLFIPPVLVAALWQRQGWRWRWFMLGALLLIAIPLLVIVDWQDAAFWYRDETDPAQAQSVRQPVAGAPFGDHALFLEMAPKNWNRRLLNPLAREQIEALRGQTVTIGGWLWADREAEASLPALAVSSQGSNNLNYTHERVPVGTTPSYFSRTLTVPQDAIRLYYLFEGIAIPEGGTPLDIFLDGAFLIEGELPAGATPRLEGNQLLTDSGARDNLLRNPSAEQAGPRTSTWLENALKSYGRRSSNYTLMALFDVERSARFLFVTILPWLARDFWVAFSWGHVRLPTLWSTLGIGLAVLATLGTVRWLVGQGRGSERRRWPALLLLLLALLVVWLNALLWPLPYAMLARFSFPSSRYVYPAIIPTMLFLVGGWWVLWPRRARPLALALLFAGLLAMNVAAILTISAFYASVAAA